MSLIDGLDRNAFSCLVTDRIYRFDSDLQMVQAKVTIYYGDDNIKERINGFPIYEEFKFNSTGQLVFIGKTTAVRYFFVVSALRTCTSCVHM